MQTVAAEEFHRRIEQNLMTELDWLPEGVRLWEDVTYAVTPERPLRLDAYLPEAAPTKPRPAMLFLHGGGWRAGTKKQFARQAAYLASKWGFFAVSAEYRFSSEARFPACVRDAKCAVKWIRAKAREFGIDPERVAVAGGSAGAHLAALVATTRGEAGYEPQAVDATCLGEPSHADLCIPLNAPLDLVALAEEGRAGEPLRALLGGDLAEVPEAYRAASPYHRAGPDAAPMLLLHGEADDLIPCSQSVRMHERLRSVGVHAELQTYPGKGHGWFNHAPDFASVLARMETFLVERFGLG